MIRLANDDDFMTALNIQISELEFELYESQKQVNGIVYATYDQIWEMNKTVKVASSNSAHRESSQGPVGYRESSQGPVLRGNIQPWDGRKPAWGYT